MITPDDSPAANDPAQGAQVWRRLARLAGADRDMTLSVAGPHGLDAMMTLCRDGYCRMECARQATSACADETSDVLLIDGEGEGAALADLIARTIGLLRDGGVLAVRLSTPREGRAVRAALAAAGFGVSATAYADRGALAAYTVRRRTPVRLAS